MRAGRPLRASTAPDDVRLPRLCARAGVGGGGAANQVRVKTCLLASEPVSHGKREGERSRAARTQISAPPLQRATRCTHSTTDVQHGVCGRRPSGAACGEPRGAGAPSLELHAPRRLLEPPPRVAAGVWPRGGRGAAAAVPAVHGGCWGAWRGGSAPVCWCSCASIPASRPAPCLSTPPRHPAALPVRRDHGLRGHELSGPWQPRVQGAWPRLPGAAGGWLA